MSNTTTSDNKRNVSTVFDISMLDEYYPNDVIISSKSPITFKVSINVRIMKLKKLYWTCNQRLKGD